MWSLAAADIALALWGEVVWLQGPSRRKSLQGESYRELANKLAGDRAGGGCGDGAGRGGDSFSQA